MAFRITGKYFSNPLLWAPEEEQAGLGSSGSADVSPLPPAISAVAHDLFRY